ncbi:expressed protein [Phakopsora pachyrhizi]|uniref:Expressed protein n=1 Tax=Phakopsora pachyrhizi TaxID=170000 RepID=A0AAV0BIG8_PHAPC|nr:expressed protein [Phakopsora pachyrhizi]
MSGWLQFRSPQWKNDDDKTQKNENSSNQSALIDSVLNHVKENVTLGQIDVTSLACQKARFVISPGIESPDRTIQYHQPPNFDNSSHSHEPSDFFSPEASQNTKSQILINNFQVNETPIMATTWQLNECTDEFSSGHNQHILRNQLTECNLSVSASLDSAGPSRPQAHENNINTLSNEPQGEKVKDSNATDEELTDNPSCEKKSLRWKPHDEWEFNEISARHSHGNGSNSMINSDDSSSLNFQEFRLQDDHRSKATLDNCDGQNSYDGEEERSLEQEVNDDSSTHSCPYHKLDGLLSQSDGTPEDLSVLSRSNLKRLKSPLLSPQKDELSVSCNETGKSFLINNSCISLERESTSPPRPEDSYLNQLYLKKKTVLNTESNFSGRQVDGYTAGHEHEGCSNNNNGCDSEYLKSDYFQHVQGNPIYDQPKAVFSLNPGEKANENRPSNNQDDAFEEDECSTVCDNRSFSVRAAQIFTKENSMAENLAERSDFQEPATLQNDKILYSSQSPNDQSFYSESNSSEAEISKYFKSAEKKRTGSSHRNPVDSFDTHLLTTPGTSLLQVCGRNEVDFDHDQKFNFQAQPSIPCSKDVHNETFAATTDPSVNSDVFSGLDLATKTGNKLNQACSLDLVMEHSDKKMLNIYARAASAPPFNKSPSFISLDSPKLASQNYSQIQSKTSKKSFSQSPIFDKSASMVPEQQNALHTTLSSNFLISKRVANSPWQASVVKTPSKLQNSYIPSSPSNTTISEGVLQAASPGSSFAKASTGRSVLLRSQRSDLSQRLNEQQLRHVVKETQSAPKHLELAASSEPKIQEEFANQFLSSPESASNPKLCTSGEAKIFTSHNQSNSLFSHVMNGPSMSRLQDQSLALLTPNQSYGLDFSSPVQVKDWSINHPPGHPRWITKADSGSETNVYLNSQAPYKLNDNRDETRNKVPVHIWNPSDESHISYWDERLLEDSPVKHRQPDGVHVIPETSSQASVVTTSQANLSGQFFAPKAGDLNLKSHHNVQRGSEPSAYPIVIHEGFGAEGAQSHLLCHNLPM